jgi:hypothetical protein
VRFIAAYRDVRRFGSLGVLGRLGAAAMVLPAVLGGEGSSPAVALEAGTGPSTLCSELIGSDDAPSVDAEEGEACVTRGSTASATAP